MEQILIKLKHEMEFLGYTTAMQDWILDGLIFSKGKLYFIEPPVDFYDIETDYIILPDTIFYGITILYSEIVGECIVRLKN
ncbi:MAG: hypothetical protein INQ03_15270 [Candidatus Heimdallarchaeota archaeon]|nr:hypothetical protein [Candidatus Heimdallarchaeota archaeon]